MGKIYGGLLILENWKATKFGKVPISEAQVIGSDAITSRKYALSKEIDNLHPALKKRNLELKIPFFRDSGTVLVYRNLKI